MKRKSTVLRIIENLKVLYPDAVCSLTYQKDYELLFATRLSAQCTDARVNQVTPELFSTYPTLEALAEASVEDVGRIIHSCGLYQTKARDLVACARMLLEQHGGEMPVKELDAELREMGYTYGTVRKAKEQLKGEQVISFHQFGSHDSKQWKVHVHSAPT